MDSNYNADDSLCDLCQGVGFKSQFCEICHVNLCMFCVGKHLSDSSRRHYVVPYKHKPLLLNYPTCQRHAQKHCELFCEECDIPVCSTCISSSKHKGHHLSNSQEKLGFKTSELQKDLKELEEVIYPAYDEIGLDSNLEKVNLEIHYEKLTEDVNKQGQELHRKVNIIIFQKRREIEDMKSKYHEFLITQENEIRQITSEVKQCILHLKKILDSNDVSLTSAYKSRNAEFRSLPNKKNVSLQTFSPNKINVEQLNQMFGSFSALSIKTEDGYSMKPSEDISYLPLKSLLDEPKLVATIDTRYKYLDNVACLNDELIWTSGNDKIIKLFNLQGKLMKSIETKSGNDPSDITVTRGGDLIYTDSEKRTVNLVINTEIKEVIKLQGWTPRGVYSTSSGDLLVTLNNGKESKVVRYCGFTEKQTIQFDDNGKPLYSGRYVKNIIENRNLDICVADSGANAVVVVNQAGKLRFRYTGHPSASKKIFEPGGITSDSQSQILTADHNNTCIHILDQDGQFLRYIDNCELIIMGPWGLCVDNKDNLFMGDDTRCGKVKKIKYM